MPDVLRPPRYADRDDDRVAATLHGAVMVVLAMGFVAGVMEPPEGPTYGPESPLLGVGGALAALALMRRGRLRTASAIFLVTFTASVAAGFLRAGTFYTPAVGAMVLTVLLAGLLLGARAALAATLGVFALLLGLEELFRSELWRQQPAWRPSGASVLWWLPTVITAGGVAALGAARVRGALDDADLSQRELERRHRALAESEERYRALVENSPLGVMTLDRDLEILSANAELLELVGAPSPAVLVGRSLADFPVFAVSQVREARARVLAGERHDFEASWESVWGRSVTARVYLAPIRSPGGELTGAQAIVEDVSEQKRLEAQLVHSQKMEVAGRIAGGIAHDFNNDLTAILGNAELLLDRRGHDAELRLSLEQVVQAAERSSTITRQLLAFSRKQVIRPRVLDPNGLIERLLPVIERVVGPNVALETRLRPGVGCVRMDPSQLEIVLVNLATNARDAMPSGGRLSLETDVALLAAPEETGLAVSPGAYLEIRVSDEGHGMDATTRNRIFEPFFTTKEEGRGTGLGLATAHGVVTQGGGAIRVGSEPGRGTRFRILLPRVEPAAGRVSRPRPSQLPGGSETILLVEDQADVRRTARAMLESHGYTVVEAAHGSQALERAAELGDRIDLLLTDVLMPGMDGVELAGSMRGRLPDLPVLLMSGYTEEANLESDDLHPVPVLLQKPFSTRDLLLRVREQLEKRGTAVTRARGAGLDSPSASREPS